MLTQILSLKLIDIAKVKGDTDRVKQYWNAYDCQSKIKGGDGRLYGNYCKTRICTLCCSIRKVERINTYYPILKEWDDSHFLTLFGMKRGLKLIRDKLRKRHERGKEIKITGVQFLECNFNPVKRWYNLDSTYSRNQAYLLLGGVIIQENQLMKTWD